MQQRMTVSKARQYSCFSLVCFFFFLFFFKSFLTSKYIKPFQQSVTLCNTDWWQYFTNKFSMTEMKVNLVLCSLFSEFKIQVFFSPPFSFFKICANQSSYHHGWVSGMSQTIVPKLALFSQRAALNTCPGYALKHITKENMSRRSKVHEKNSTVLQCFPFFWKGNTVHPYSLFPAFRKHMLVSHILTLAVCIRGFQKGLLQVCLVSRYMVRKRYEPGTSHTRVVLFQQAVRKLGSLICPKKREKSLSVRTGNSVRVTFWCKECVTKQRKYLDMKKNRVLYVCMYVCVYVCMYISYTLQI